MAPRFERAAHRDRAGTSALKTAGGRAKHFSSGRCRQCRHRGLMAWQEVRFESARRTYKATTLPFSASLAATFWPALFSSVVVATWNAAISVVRARVRVRVNKTLTWSAAISARRALCWHGR